LGKKIRNWDSLLNFHHCERWWNCVQTSRMKNGIAIPWKAFRIESFVHSKVSLWICRRGNRVHLDTCKSQNEDNSNLQEGRLSKFHCSCDEVYLPCKGVT
jgi:hypothetical protein